MNLNKRLGRALLSTYKKRQQSASNLSVENCLEAARTIVRRSKYCFLITNGESGWPSARLVEPIVDPDQFNCFIGTNPSLRKVREIEASPQVTVAFGDQAHDANLVLYGRASVSLDPDSKRKYWKGTWRLFFPDGSQGEDYAVVRVVTDRLEVLSFRGNVVPEPFGLKPAVLTKTGDAWHLEP